jgi:hypothetical protein
MIHNGPLIEMDAFNPHLEKMDSHGRKDTATWRTGGRRSSGHRRFSPHEEWNEGSTNLDTSRLTLADRAHPQSSHPLIRSSRTRHEGPREDFSASRKIIRCGRST